MKTIITSLLLSFLLVGCASKGFNRGELKDQIGVKKLQVNDAEIKEVLKRKANLPKPFKLAVYFAKPANSLTHLRTKWRWTDKDRDALKSVEEQLKKEGLVSQVIPMMDSLVKEQDIKSIRLAAAKYGADAVLVIDGVADIDRYMNKLGYSYALLIPALFVPGSEVDGLFIANASLWDVRNEFLYLTAESEGTFYENYIPVFGTKDKEIIQASKQKAMEQLSKNISDMIKGM